MDTMQDERLYNLLPAIYRIRDVERGEPLRALLAVIEREMDRLEQDIDGLYDDWFIETCAEWVVPYIGDLLGVRNVQTIDSAGIFSARAYVANTLRYRRRKGTAPVLEQLARDVTGWPARAVEFFERLIASQHVNHVRLHSAGTVDLRHASQLELLDGPFESAAHSVEVRRITSGRGRYNIPNLGLFLWRLQSYYITQSTPRPLTEPPDGRYTFSPLGNDNPLFNRPQTETEITHLAEEINVPDRLRRRALYEALEALRQALVDGQPHPESVYLSSANPALQIFVADNDDALKAIPPEEILICDLGDLPGVDDWRRPPTDKAYVSRTRLDDSVDPPVPLQVTRPIQVAVDPERGRLAFPAGETPARVAVSYAYGFSGDIGGGPYGRRASLATPASVTTWTRTVGRSENDDVATDFDNLAAALAAWQSDAPSDAIITIMDSRIYQEALSLAFAPGQHLVIQAADGRRPTVRVFQDGADLAELVISGGTGADAGLTLNGLWIEGGIRIEAGSLETLLLEHCTLVPGRGLDAVAQPRRPAQPSLVTQLPNAELQITIRRSIVGPLHLPDEIKTLSVTDSVVHAPLRDGPARYTPALISGNLAPFPTLSAAAPQLLVQIGDEGPHAVALGPAPTTLSQARDALQTALQAAHRSQAFAAAQVIVAANRLVILPGTPGRVQVRAAEGDATATELRLTDDTDARGVQALVSPSLTPFPTLRSAAPALHVTLGAIGPQRIDLSPPLTSVAQVRDQLHAAIRAAHAEPAFQHAIVGNLAEQLVVLPGTADAPLLFSATADDATTLLDLGLHADQPALAADSFGDRPGPATQLERVTILGAVHVRELTLASESIFTGRVLAQRQQVGCTRFCSLPDGSHVPRRHRCQPDLALAAFARERGKASVDDLTNAARAAVLARLTPTFTSVRYGEPAYAQLDRRCAVEIRTGAADGSEMGVFHHLKQPQREANLRTSLAEYLRFGLEAGIFYVT